jgi:hypothetical protein
MLTQNRFLQITSESVKLLSASDANFKTNQWTPPNRISLASVNPKSGQFLVVSGNKLFYLLVKDDEIVLLEHLECINEIACVDISPLCK